MKQHRLSREIIATQLSKSIADHMGVNFIERLQSETGASVEFIVRSFVIADELYELTALWRQIEALDWKINPSVQHKMMLQVYFLIRRATRWFLRNCKPDIQIEKTIMNFNQRLVELMKKLPALLTAPEQDYLKANVEEYTKQGVPAPLAKKIASCEPLFTSLDIVQASIKHDFDTTDVAKTYYALDARLELNWLRNQMNAYPMENQWDELARSAFRDDLDRVQKKLSVSVLKARHKKTVGQSIEERIDSWVDHNKHLISRWEGLLADIKSSSIVGFVSYSVVLRELFDFAQA
jgi:glutamate dehydrogenase